MSHIFISYSRRDMTAMQVVRHHLEMAGLPVWVDNKIMNGESFSPVIEQAIRNALGLIVIASSSAKESEWVLKEIKLASKLNKPIYPVIVSHPPEAAEIFDIIHLNYTVLYPNYPQELDKLVKTIQEQFGLETQATFPSIDPDGVQWQRLGSLYWFASDSRRLRDLLHYESTPASKIRETLVQVYHHARRIQLDTKSLSELERILQETEHFTDRDWTPEARRKYGDRIKKVAHYIAGMAERLDTSFTDGPRSDS